MNKLYGIRGAEHVKARAEFERINAAIAVLEQEVKAQPAAPGRPAAETVTRGGEDGSVRR